MDDGDSSMLSILPQSRGKMDKYPMLTNNRIVKNYNIPMCLYYTEPLKGHVGEIFYLVRTTY